MAELSEIEQTDTGDPDAAANCFGRLMGELFVTGELWDDRLRPFGEALGRFIYLLDAVIDLPRISGTGGITRCARCRRMRTSTHC